MDTLDVKILREIGCEAYSPFPSTVASLRKIGQALDVDKDTVRNRLRVLGERGVIGGWHSMINPNVLSMKVTRIWLEYPSETLKEDNIKRLSTVSNVRAVYDYVGHYASFVIVADSRKNQREQVEKIAPSSQAEILFSATMIFPVSKATLTEADWMIYRAIRDNPQKPQDEISAETGLSVRTVKRRLQKLTEEKSFLVVPDLEPKRLEGIAADLVVKYSSGDLARTHDELLTRGVEFVIHAEQFEEPLALFSFLFSNISRAQETRRHVLSQRGVLDARLFILQNTLRIRTPLHSSAAMIPLPAQR